MAKKKLINPLKPIAAIWVQL